MSKIVTNTKMIYHCTNTNMKGGGGIETYVASLALSKISGVSDRVLKEIKTEDQTQFELLHIHDPELLADIREECPTIFTLHNHCTYCPSGTKYLADRGKICDRSLDPLGCLWGHVVDGCGSRRPHKIIGDWWNAYNPLTILKTLKIPVIANSEYVRQQIIRVGIAPERIITLHCGVRSPNLPTEPLKRTIHQNQRILFVGRIVPDKGLDWLLKALSKTERHIHLDIAGDGWSKPRMEQLAQDLGLSDRITWHGWCNPEQLETLYQQCLAVIFPSLWPEPAGLVTLEAYARYRPVIASAVGGIPEYVQDGKTGILISPNDISQLAAAINELANNYRKARLIGEQGQAWYQEEYTIDIHVQRLAAIYTKTITEFHARNNQRNLC
ncbi:MULTISPECIES: glycosyltransferase family 4 protein [Calothrix]|uniref:Glycosyltransferase family 4 protein n=2 Tax=Calothrix TaxID=1186 RepID=A0ABR8ADL4_9CYAN|nr:MULTISPECIES: glycosyltransferase family 4 protein [Calothrix]MBD2198018.1 glycosyltransferase family 4 protein [Calothrix parietina FACHB-288]MBD2226349.1 glycosyltransferase family 4 protein [Calothrix anomala FACHB-343]